MKIYLAEMYQVEFANGGVTVMNGASLKLRLLADADLHMSCGKPWKYAVVKYGRTSI